MIEIIVLFMFFLIIVALVGVILYREKQHQHQLSNLLDRLMSKNFRDYKNYSDEPEENNFSDDSEHLINLEEAREDIMSPGA